MSSLRIIQDKEVEPNIDPGNQNNQSQSFTWNSPKVNRSVCGGDRCDNCARDRSVKPAAAAIPRFVLTRCARLSTNTPLRGLAAKSPTLLRLRLRREARRRRDAPKK